MKFFVNLLLIFFCYKHTLSFSKPELRIPGGDTLPSSAVHKALFEPVLFPCNECIKIIDKYVNKCVKDQIEGAKIRTFLSFCEALALEQDPKYNASTYKYCIDIHDRLLQNHQQPDDNKADYNPFELDVSENFFVNFRKDCEKFDEIPKTLCYSGFCDKIVECIDCPYGLNQNNQELEVQVCSGHGVCRLGWLREKERKGGNGFCECYEGRKGLACDQISGEGIVQLGKNRIDIQKK